MRSFGQYGSGPGDLNHPGDLVIDGDGNVYVADTSNHRVQVFRASGAAAHTIGSFGTGRDELNGPRSLAISAAGELHVLDGGNARVQVYTLGGKHLYSYGTYGTRPGEFLLPTAIVSDSHGRSYVADPGNGRITVFASGGKLVRRFRPKNDKGERVAPVGLEMTHDDRLYVWTAGHAALPVAPSRRKS